MLGKMMHKQLTISSLLEHAGRYHGDTTVTSVETSGETVHSNWGEVEANARKLASALKRLGLAQEDCAATIAWNNRRHLEIYFGVAGGGFICHTINPRLFPEQLIYIINHAEDKVLFIDATFVPAVAKLRPHLPNLRHVILMGARDDTAAQQIDGLLFYDELLAGEPDDCIWPEIDENLPSSLCYTSGTRTANAAGTIANMAAHRAASGTIAATPRSRTRSTWGVAACTAPYRMIHTAMKLPIKKNVVRLPASLPSDSAA